MIRQCKPGFFALPVLLLATWVLQQPAIAAEEQQPKLETDDQKLSYVLGMDFGEVIKRIKADANIDPALVVRAIADVLAGKTTLLAPQQANEIKQAFSQKMQERLATEHKVQADKNRTEGEAFLAQNRTKQGVVTTASGLQYEVITPGQGTKPTATDTVTVNYRGTLLDGSEFDSSYKRGKPATFPVDGVIPGWSEALQLMPVGSKYRLFIPADLGYGERGAGRQIGPNATLVFEVELLNLDKQAGSQPETEAPPTQQKPTVAAPPQTTPQPGQGQTPAGGQPAAPPTSK